VAELKTRPTGASVRAFLASLDDAVRLDCAVLAKMMRSATGERAVMWGPSLVGFGSYHYVYASGHSGDWFLTGFAPRKRDLTIYIMLGFASYAPLLAKLGRHKHAKSCLYLRSLADVDLGVLRELVERSVADLREVYPPAKS
jgi:hypothetical protein